MILHSTPAINHSRLPSCQKVHIYVGDSEVSWLYVALFGLMLCVHQTNHDIFMMMVGTISGVNHCDT